MSELAQKEFNCSGMCYVTSENHRADAKIAFVRFYLIDDGSIHSSRNLYVCRSIRKKKKLPSNLPTLGTSINELKISFGILDSLGAR